MKLVLDRHRPQPAPAIAEPTNARAISRWTNRRRAITKHVATVTTPAGSGINGVCTTRLASARPLEGVEQNLPRRTRRRQGAPTQNRDVRCHGLRSAPRPRERNEATMATPPSPDRCCICAETGCGERSDVGHRPMSSSDAQTGQPVHGRRTENHGPGGLQPKRDSAERLGAVQHVCTCRSISAKSQSGLCQARRKIRARSAEASHQQDAPNEGRGGLIAGGHLNDTVGGATGGTPIAV